MRNVRLPSARASLASWVVDPEDSDELVVDGGVCVGEEPPVPVVDGVVPAAAAVGVAAPAAGASANPDTAMPATSRFRALITGKRRHDLPASRGARTACAALLRRSFSEQVRLPELVPPHPAEAGRLIRLCAPTELADGLAPPLPAPPP